MPGWLSRRGPVMVRVGAAVIVGGAVAFAIGVSVGWAFAPVLAWVAAAAVYLAWTWSVIARMPAQITATHATREDPTRFVADLIVWFATLASLVGVGYLLFGESARGGSSTWAAAAGVGSVVAAWFVVHTLFTTRYARLYYGEPRGGVDFNQDDLPNYLDFAYLSFTIGMTFQVSDTNIRARSIRATALRHAVLSYFFGAVVIAITINLIAGLGSAGH